MSQFRFACNFKQCRKPLLKSAYVTKCSHIFCNAHGLNITTGEELICPVCDNHFQTIQDVIRVNLEPDEITKSVCKKMTKVVLLKFNFVIIKNLYHHHLGNGSGITPRDNYGHCHKSISILGISN